MRFLPSVAVLILPLALLSAPCAADPEKDVRLYGRDRPVDYLHMRLDVTVDAAGLGNGTFSGRVEYEARPRFPAVDRVVLDAVDMEILDVTVEGETAPYVYDDKTLTVELGRTFTPGETFRLAVRYRVLGPSKGLYVIPENPAAGLPAALYSFSEPYLTRRWLPCHDDPQERWTAEIAVTVPDGYQAVATGLLRHQAGSTWTWRLDEPIHAQGMGFAVGRWTRVDLPSWRGRPLVAYVQKGYEENARVAFAVVPEALEFFAELTDFEPDIPTYVHATIPGHHHGGMEHATFSEVDPRLLTLGPSGEVPPHYTEMHYIAHMLAHVWFSSTVSYRSTADAWLNEGFASYVNYLLAGERQGEAVMTAHLWNGASRIARREKSGSPLVQRDTEAASIFGRDAGKVYWKGAWVVHMLRRELGDDVFWRGVKTYLERHQGTAVGSAMLRRALEDVSGRDLERFFDQWVHGAGFPELKVTSSWDATAVEVTVEQTRAVTPEAPLFTFPLEVCFRVGAEDVCRVAEISGPRHELSWEVDAEVTQIAVDPHQRLLKALDEEKPRAFWRAQARDGMTVNARLDAVAHLGQDDTGVATLAEVLADPREVWPVRAQAARALGAQQDSEALAALLAAAEKTPDSKLRDGGRLRAAVYAGLGSYPMSEPALRALLASSPEEAVEAEAAAVGALGGMAPGALGDRLLERLLAALQGRRWVRPRAFSAVRRLELHGAFAAVFAQARPGTDEHWRPQAIATLGVLGRDDETRDRTLEALRQWLSDANPAVRLASIRALGRLGDRRALADLGRLAESARPSDERDAARKAAEAIREALPDE